MSSFTAHTHPITKAEVVWWAVAVVVTGVVLPGLGLLLAVGLCFTRLRTTPASTRWGLVALGVAVLVIQVVGLLAGSGPDLHVSPIVPAG
ncbi:MAG: hypothetical protein ABIQ59_13815 [Nocardioidaceae bacterium]